jgi:LuxR family transcriptional regulator, maltose regulon positive regulatory protein
MLAKVALGAGDHQAAREQLRALPPAGLTPRHALVRQLLLAAAAISRAAPEADSLVRGCLTVARRDGFLNTVVTAAPQLTGYLVGHSFQARADPFADQLVAAALEVRAAAPGPASSRRALAEPLTPAEQRVLQLLPTSTYVQMAATLYVSHNTVKTHLRAVYQKLGVTSRAEAIERAVDLRLL